MPSGAHASHVATTAPQFGLPPASPLASSFATVSYGIVFMIYAAGFLVMMLVVMQRRRATERERAWKQQSATRLTSASTAFEAAAAAADAGCGGRGGLCVRDLEVYQLLRVQRRAPSAAEDEEDEEEMIGCVEMKRHDACASVKLQEHGSHPVADVKAGAAAVLHDRHAQVPTPPVTATATCLSRRTSASSAAAEKLRLASVTKSLYLDDNTSSVVLSSESSWAMRETSAGVTAAAATAVRLRLRRLRREDSGRVGAGSCSASNASPSSMLLLPHSSWFMQTPPSLTSTTTSSSSSASSASSSTVNGPDAETVAPASAASAALMLHASECVTPLPGVRRQSASIVDMGLEYEADAEVDSIASSHAAVTAPPPPSQPPFNPSTASSPARRECTSCYNSHLSAPRTPTLSTTVLASPISPFKEATSCTSRVLHAGDQGGLVATSAGVPVQGSVIASLALQPAGILDAAVRVKGHGADVEDGGDDGDAVQGDSLPATPLTITMSLVCAQASESAGESHLHPLHEMMLARGRGGAGIGGLTAKPSCGASALLSDADVTTPYGHDAQIMHDVVDTQPAAQRCVAPFAGMACEELCCADDEATTRSSHACTDSTEWGASLMRLSTSEPPPSQVPHELPTGVATEMRLRLVE